MKTCNYQPALFLGLAVASCLLATVCGMAELTEEMMQAKDLDELLAAEGNQFAQKIANSDLRDRVLREEGLEDSMHILADYFGGEPGFYHGVASGKSFYFYKSLPLDIDMSIGVSRFAILRFLLYLLCPLH